MAADEVKIEFIGVSNDLSDVDRTELAVIEGKEAKGFEVTVEEAGAFGRVVLKDVEGDSSGDSADQDALGNEEVGRDSEPGQKTEDGKAGSEGENPQDEEEEEECGFCIFMKNGPCGDRFSIWQKCLDSAEKSGENIVEKCAQTTSLLKVCMEMNLEYYGPVLDAEKAMEEDVAREERQRLDSGKEGAEDSKQDQSELSEEDSRKQLDAGAGADESKQSAREKSEEDSRKQSDTGKVVSPSSDE